MDQTLQAFKEQIISAGAAKTPLRIRGNHYQRLSVFAEDPITVYQTVCEGRPSFDTHQLGTLVIPHPDLLRAGIAYAEVIAF